MDRQTRYPKEVRERAVRLVFEHEREYSSQWAAICSISSKLGMTAETLRKWVRRAETDEGLRGGMPPDPGAGASVSVSSLMTASIPYTALNPMQYCSAASLDTPYGEMGMGTRVSRLGSASFRP